MQVSSPILETRPIYIYIYITHHNKGNLLLAISATEKKGPSTKLKAEDESKGLQNNNK